MVWKIGLPALKGDIMSAMDEYAVAYLNAYHEFRKAYMKDKLTTKDGIDFLLLEDTDVSFKAIHLLFQQSLNNKA